MSERGSVFSNGSINGFKSVLFLPSEFHPDRESEVCIPIDLADVSVHNKNQLDRFQELILDKNWDCRRKDSSYLETQLSEKKTCELESHDQSFELININDRRINSNLTKKKANLVISDHFSSKPLTEHSSFQSTYHGTSKALTGDLSMKSQSNKPYRLPVQATMPLLSPQVLPSMILPQSYPKKICLSGQLPITMNTMVYLNLLKEKQNVGINSEQGSINKSANLGSRVSSKNDGDWICCKCNNLNYAFRDFCNRCGDKSKH